MTLTRRTRRAVDGELARLREEHGEFELVEKTWSVDVDASETTRERFEAGTVGGAGAWVRDDESRAVVVRHEGERSWSDPGGKGEPGESLEETARRETREEAGVDCTIDGVVQAHVVETVCETNSDECEVGDHEYDPLYRLIVVFEATYEGGELRPREGEIAAAKWVTELPEELLYPELAAFPL
ncbi:NUDIX domain-containing protein [Halogranum amylolyticum]|uniref:NUDIX domain-containing protein n=1 Tax=Halogranum amylolyticum TaxID=660520 RepID=A0A1H8PFZ0_9EURY|nr:NUDIX domain-containing protein [Halogranum amylolyticum]SEO40825.1 NUDIX domain-containing protein [Halogranum amylolyticum]